MRFLTWIVIGFIAGWIARIIMGGKGPEGLIVTGVIGIVGALIGGYIGSLLGLGEVTGFNVASLVLATMGAVLLLMLFQALRR